VNRFFLPLLIFTATGLVLSIVGMVLTMPGSDASAARVSQHNDTSLGLWVPEFELTAQDGEPRTHEMFEGRITILDFMFTHCPFACPGMKLAMEELTRRLQDTNVQFVSITVDPERDTPERLGEFAAERGYDTSRWTLLTGRMDVITHIATDSLKLLVQPDERVQIPLPDGSEMANVIHPTKFILVGPDREVLALYEATFPEDLEALERRARAAAGGAGR
jgi:protein SCO1